MRVFIVIRPNVHPNKNPFIYQNQLQSQEASWRFGQINYILSLTYKCHMWLLLEI